MSESEAERSADSGGRQRLARVVIGVSRGLHRLLPPPLRRRLENRVFFSVFQVTRVTNDAYGWKPKEDE